MCFYIFRQLLFVYLYFRSHIEQLCRDVELAFINTSEPAINKSYDAEELFVRSDAVAFFFFWMMNKAKLIRKLDETYGVTISKSVYISLVHQSFPRQFKRISNIKMVTRYI